MSILCGGVGVLVSWCVVMIVKYSCRCLMIFVLICAAGESMNPIVMLAVGPVGEGCSTASLNDWLQRPTVFSFKFSRQWAEFLVYVEDCVYNFHSVLYRYISVL